MKSALLNSTKRLQDEQGKEYLPFEQGAGRLQVDKAIQTSTLISPATLSFGELEKGEHVVEKEVTISIENISKSQKDYTIDPPIGEIDGISWEFEERVTVNGQSKKGIYTHSDH